MQKVLDRGGVIAGSSAGASIQGEYMPRGNPLGNLDIMADGYEQGLGFFKGVGIDQHFTQRGRGPDMASLVTRYRQLLGIGLDEGTAIVVQGRFAEVVGAAKVSFYDGKKPLKADGTPVFVQLGSGSYYDLVDRKEVTRETVRSSQ
jgi:cyanophycinase